MKLLAVGHDDLRLPIGHFILDLEVLGPAEPDSSIAQFILHEVHIVLEAVDLSDVKVSFVAGGRIVQDRARQSVSLLWLLGASRHRFKFYYYRQPIITVHRCFGPIESEDGEITHH